MSGSSHYFYRTTPASPSPDVLLRTTAYLTRRKPQLKQIAKLLMRLRSNQKNYAPGGDQATRFER